MSGVRRMRWVELHYFGHRFTKPDTYLAYWHTGGGAHHYIITSFDVAEKLRAADHRNWKITREVTEENFFKVLKRYTEFEVRKADNTVYIAIPPYLRGWWIGKGGHRIRKIQNILSSKVTLVDCPYVKRRRIWFIRWQEQEQTRYVGIEPHDGSLVKDLSDSNGRQGYMAPWNIKRLMGLVEYVDDWDVKIIPDSTMEAIRIARQIFRDLPFIKLGTDGTIEVSE
jgi:hypothetical protein